MGHEPGPAPEKPQDHPRQRAGGQTAGSTRGACGCAPPASVSPTGTTGARRSLGLPLWGGEHKTHKHAHTITSTHPYTHTHTSTPIPTYIHIHYTNIHTPITRTHTSIYTHKHTIHTHPHHMNTQPYTNTHTEHTIVSRTANLKLRLRHKDGKTQEVGAEMRPHFGAGGGQDHSEDGPSPNGGPRWPG